MTEPTSDQVSNQVSNPVSNQVSDQVSEQVSAQQTGPSLLSSSAVMAAGTVVSRLSGFVRGILLAAAVGVGLHADVFNIANMVPTMLYVLLAGGVVNAVLVPQLVRAGRNDPDGGEAYTNRVMTLAALFLLVVTVVLVVVAPLLMALFLDPRFFEPSRREQLESVVDLARYCLPQVFFYGMFVLVGQVLNARGTFGPMMWAPIANNVVSVGVLISYLVVFGPAVGADKQGGYDTGRELLLGLGSTAGIVVQFLVLIPYLRAAGVRFRPRLDLRGSGLGHTLRLAVWSVLFVAVNQVAYTVVVRLASSGTVGGSEDGAGYTVYSNAYLLTLVPHAVITVSLATAMLPLLSRHADSGDLAALGRSVGSTLRSSYALILPAAVFLALMALDVSQVVWGYGSASADFGNFAPSLALFGPALVLFTAHYLVLRGFYAMEQNRRVFLIQCVVAATNVVAAVLLVRGAPVTEVAPRLVVAYATAYGVGAVLSYAVLAREVGHLGTHTLVRFLVRVGLALALSAALAWGARQLLGMVPGSGRLHALLDVVVVGAVFTGCYLGVARVLRITEVTEVVALVTRRLGVRRLGVRRLGVRR